MQFDFNAAVAEIQGHPRILDAGMVLMHYGLVRSFNLQGQTVISLDVQTDTDQAENIRRELVQRPGIIEIVVRLNQGLLKPGDPIMLAAVAGGNPGSGLSGYGRTYRKAEKRGFRKKGGKPPDQEGSCHRTRLSP